MPLYRGGWIDTIPDSQELSKQNKQPDRQSRGHLHMHKHGTDTNNPSQRLLWPARLLPFPGSSIRARNQEGSPPCWLGEFTLAWWPMELTWQVWKGIIFNLKMGTVTLKGLTSQPRLSLSGPSYLLRDFFRVFSAGRTRSVQICTATQRKGQGWDPPPLFTKRMQHSTRLKAGE